MNYYPKKEISPATNEVEQVNIKRELNVHVKEELDIKFEDDLFEETHQNMSAMHSTQSVLNDYSNNGNALVTVKKEELSFVLKEEPDIKSQNDSKEVELEDKKPDNIEICDKPNRFYCDLCNKNYNTKWTLVRHMKRHSKKRSFKCKKCKKGFALKSRLKKHWWTHIGEKHYACHKCKKVLSTEINLKKHLQVHADEKPYYPCNLCDKSFTLKCNLTKHIRVHTGVKPYVCNICNKAFNTKCNWETHLYVHSGVKPYTCDLCNKTFRTKYNLKKHIRIHTGEKPYTCNICNKAFTLKCTLNKHMQVHTCKPYTCSCISDNPGTENNLLFEEESNGMDAGSDIDSEYNQHNDLGIASALPSISSDRQPPLPDKAPKQALVAGSTVLRPLLVNNHFSVRIVEEPLRRQCVWCKRHKRRGRTSRRCDVCDVALCIDCMKPYHTCVHIL